RIAARQVPTLVIPRTPFGCRRDNRMKRLMSAYGTKRTSCCTAQCPLLEVKRTWAVGPQISGYGELTEHCMSRKAGKTQLELLIKVTKARLPARQAFMANMLGNVRQLLRDLPLDRPLIEHTDEEIIALVRRMFRERSAKRDSLLNRSIGRRKRKR